MNYKEHLQSLVNLSEIEQHSMALKLIETSPFAEWPGGMPASVDPKLILIGVSPGNSPMQEHRQEIKDGPVYTSEPSVIKGENNHFYYPDTSGYWKKLRMFCSIYFKYYDKSMSDRDSISLTTHLNLGTGSAGSATKCDVEKNVIKWVSTLLNTVHNPDVVILFGLKQILEDKEISSWWNHSEGININWNKPDIIKPFSSYKKCNYLYRIWNVKNHNGKHIKFVIWPNHPSRAPFSNYEIWKNSVDDFLSINDNIAKTSQLAASVNIPENVDTKI